MLYARKLSEDAIPRGIRWSAEEEPDHEQLQNELADEARQVHAILVAEEDEEEILSKCYFSDEESDEHFDNIVKSIETSASTRRTERRQLEVDVGTNDMDSNVDSLNSKHVMGAITELAHTMRRIEKSLVERLQRIEERLDKIILPHRETSNLSPMNKVDSLLDEHDDRNDNEVWNTL